MPHISRCSTESYILSLTQTLPKGHFLNHSFELLEWHTTNCPFFKWKLHRFDTHRVTAIDGEHTHLGFPVSLVSSSFAAPLPLRVSATPYSRGSEALGLLASWASIWQSLDSEGNSQSPWESTWRNLLSCVPPSIHLSTHSIHPFIHPFVYLSTYLSICHLSIYLSHLSILSIHLCSCLYVFI